MSRLTARLIMLCLGVFLASAAFLSIEILLIRAAQVAFGIDYKFLLIPLALLGVGLGSAAIFFGRRYGSWPYLLPVLAVGVSVSAPLPFIVARWARPSGSSVAFEFGFIALGALFCAFVGALLAAAFRTCDLRPALLYAVDLIGAGVGVIATVLIMDSAGYEQALIVALCSTVACVFSFALHASIRPHVILVMCGVPIIALMLIGASSAHSLSILCSSPTLATQSNSFSQIDVAPVPADAFGTISHEFGPEPPQMLRGAQAYRLGVDCFWIMSLLVDAARPEDATFLASAMRDIPFAVHSSHEGDRALILGAGAGIDVLRARMHGLRAVAVEINPLMLETAELFVTPSQYAYTGEDVTLVLDDARMFAETTDERFDVILSAKSGRYGGVGADVDFVSYDETVEAFASYLELLRPEGVFVFTTLPRLMENRNITMAIRALERMMLDPEGRIMLIRGREGKEDMLVIGRELFSSDKVAAYTREAAERGFNSIEVLDAATIADYTSRFGLMTDERPVPARFKIDVFGYSLSYIQAMLMILSGLVFFGILLWRRLMRRAAELASRQDLARFMIVLSTSSVGFVVFELLSIQRFFYVLGSPAYVLPTVLATVLLGGSVGSLISSYFADYRYAFRTFSLAMLACLGAYGIALDTSFEVLVMHTDAVRIGAVVLILLPPSIALGAFFPLSMRYAALRTPELIPWAWAISGMMAVSGGIVAKFLFASLGFDELLLFLAASYVVIFIAAGRLQAHSHTAS